MEITKRAAGYNDDFLVRKVEGGYIVMTEVTENIDQARMPDPEAHAVQMLVPPAMQAAMNRVQHKRTIVAKSKADIIAQLSEWLGD